MSSPHILFVDDDEDVLKAAGLLLGRHGLRMTSARSPAEAWSALAAGPVDVVLLDLNFTRGATGGEEGFRHLAEIIGQDRDAVVVVVTGHSGVNIAVAAMRAGASDFVMKPWRNDRLVATLEAAVELRRSRRGGLAKADDPAPVLRNEDMAAPLLGESAAIQRVRSLIDRAAPTDAPVLIYGAPGTGKSLIARTLHQKSSRLDGPFVTVDFGALNPAEAEAALFGDPQGGGSAAVIDARGGTLVLDKIEAMHSPLQARLFTALETGRLDIRLVSTTCRARDELGGRGGVRDELLYRLNTVEIFTPTLGERGGDALLLARHFLRLYAGRYGRPAKALGPDAAAAISRGPWPGDVRALRQAMERYVIFSEGELYEPSDLPLTDNPSPVEGAPAAPLDLAGAERTLIASALERHSFNVSHAAAELGLSRAALYRRMAKHGL